MYVENSEFIFQIILLLKKYLFFSLIFSWIPNIFFFSSFPGFLTSHFYLFLFHISFSTNSFDEVWLIHKKLQNYTYLHNLRSFKHMYHCNYHHEQSNKDTHHIQKFPHAPLCFGLWGRDGGGGGNTRLTLLTNILSTQN